MKSPAARGSRLSLKVASVGAISSLCAVVALLAIARWQSGEYEKLARGEIDYLLSDDLDRITLGTYAHVKAEDRAVNQELESALNVARRLFRESGASIAPAADTARVLARVVNETTALVGAAATVFRRENEAGDMLRVATTVRDASGRPAVGTYIRALDPDGRPDPVVSAVLGGGTFHDRAFVVDSWYIAAYEPVRDGSGRIAGMLFVGILQAVAEDRIRETILATRIGKTGYVYVVSGRGENRGRYIISQGGARDGEYIWDTRDPDGRYVVREIVDAALDLPQGGLGSIRYRWQNPGEPEPRWRTVRIMYYRPWDWVIGTSVYEDEIKSYSLIMSSGRKRMTGTMAIAGAAIAILIGAAAGIATFRMSAPLRRIAIAAEKVALVGTTERIVARSRDEIGALANAFNIMSRRVENTLATLRGSEEKYRRIFENALEGIALTTFAGKALAVNPAIAKMLGYDSPKQAIESTNDLGTILYVNRRDRDDILAELRKSGYIRGHEVQIRRKDGSVFWAAISARAEADEEGRMSRILSFITDIDQRRRADEALRISLIEKDELLKEIHHRVKNNLQVVASLIDMQKRAVSGDKSLSLYDDFANRVLAMSQVHELLYESSNLSRIDFAEYARMLAENLRQACLISPDEIELAMRCERVELRLEQAMPCGLFLNEILSNAFRHAFPPPRSEAGRVVIELACGADDVVELAVSDNGVGMPATMPREGTPRHLGLALIDLLAAQLDGTLERGGGPGTSYRLRFKRLSNGKPGSEENPFAFARDTAAPPAAGY